MQGSRCLGPQPVILKCRDLATWAYVHGKQARTEDFHPIGSDSQVKGICRIYKEVWTTEHVDNMQTHGGIGTRRPGATQV